MSSGADHCVAGKRKGIDFGDDPALPLCFPKKIPTKDNLKLRWTERVTSSYVPSANFIFEVTFPDVDSMRFDAITKCIHYSEDSEDFMECCAVNEVMPFFSNVIYPGDILLRVNGQSLLRKSVNGEFIDPQKSSSCLENIAAAALSASSTTPTTSTVTIRFMRTGSTSMNFTPSPAELNLFQVDKHIAAKFNVVKLASPTQLSIQSTQSTESDDTLQWSIQLTYLDQQLPSSISQMMLGGSVTWSHSLILSSSGPAALAQCTQGGVLATSTGIASLIHGPGAFIGTNGAPSNFSDAWNTPSSSHYTSLPINMNISAHQRIHASKMQKSLDHCCMDYNSTVSSCVSTIMKKQGNDALNNVKHASTSSKLLEPDIDHMKGVVVSAGCSVHLLDVSTFATTAGGITLGAAGGLTAGPGLVGATGIPGAIMGAQPSNSISGVSINASSGLKYFPRWSVTLTISVKDDSSPEEIINIGIGRFDKQADAQFAGEKAVELVEVSKQFRLKQFAAKFAATFSAYIQTQQQSAIAIAAKPLSNVHGLASGGIGGMPVGVGTGKTVPTGTVGGTSVGVGAGIGKHPLGAAGQQVRPGASNANIALNAALSSKVNSTGQAACKGFSSIAKVVVNISQQGTMHNSGSSGNVSGMNAHYHRK